jgi:hypothetical protein
LPVAALRRRRLDLTTVMDVTFSAEEWRYRGGWHDVVATSQAFLTWDDQFTHHLAELTGIPHCRAAPSIGHYKRVTARRPETRSADRSRSGESAAGSARWATDRLRREATGLVRQPTMWMHHIPTELTFPTRSFCSGGTLHADLAGDEGEGAFHQAEEGAVRCAVGLVIIFVERHPRVVHEVKRCAVREGDAARGIGGGLDNIGLVDRVADM